MDDYFNKSILFDLYGGILSDKEKIVYEYRILDDLSFQEIGDELNITRQAAYELYKKADKRLVEIDRKLELSSRLKEIENLANNIIKIAKNNQKIINLSNKIIQKTIKGGNN